MLIWHHSRQCSATVVANAALEEKIRALEGEVAGLLRKLSKVVVHSHTQSSGRTYAFHRTATSTLPQTSEPRTPRPS